jgi:hypothetical protein
MVLGTMIKLLGYNFLFIFGLVEIALETGFTVSYFLLFSSLLQ